MDSKVSTETVEKVTSPSRGRAADLDDTTRRAERKLRTKIDLYVVPTVALLYLMCFIDRANIGNARLAGFERDLKLQGYDYNGFQLGQSRKVLAQSRNFLGKMPRNVLAWLNSLCNHFKTG